MALDTSYETADPFELLKKQQPDPSAFAAGQATQQAAAAADPSMSFETGGQATADPWATSAAPNASGTLTDSLTPPRQTTGPDIKPAGASGTEVGGVDAATSKIQQSYQQLQQATDPQTRATMHDQIARDVYASLKGAGHDVSWQGEQLMVDGRTYDVAGGSPDTAPGGTPNQGAPTSSGRPSLNPRDASSASAFIDYMAGQPGADPSLSSDKKYWMGLVTSGQLGSDANYIADKMLNNWKIPKGGSRGRLSLDDLFHAPGATGVATSPAATDRTQAIGPPATSEAGRYGVFRGGMAPPGAHQNADGSWDWDDPSQHVDDGGEGGYPGQAPPGASQNTNGSWAWDASAATDTTVPAPGSGPDTTGPAPGRGPDTTVPAPGSGPDTTVPAPGSSKGPDAVAAPAAATVVAPPTVDPSARFAASAPRYQPGEMPGDIGHMSFDDTMGRIGAPVQPSTLATSYKPADVNTAIEHFDLPSLQKMFQASSPDELPHLVESYVAGQVRTNSPIPDLASLMKILPASSEIPRLVESYAPGHVDVATPDAYRAGTLTNPAGSLGLGEVGQKVASGTSALLDDPLSLNDREVAMLKGKTREEQSGLAAQADEDLQGFGAQAGITDSRWLASERAGNLRSRDEAVIRSNREIDIQAANQRAADKRAALQLGSDVSNTQAASQRADAALQMQRELEQEGLSQAEVASKMAAAGFSRESQLINEQLRGQAFDRSNAATQENIRNLLAKEAGQREAANIGTGRALEGASFEQAGQKTNAELRAQQQVISNAATEANAKLRLGAESGQREGANLATGRALEAASFEQGGQEFNVGQETTANAQNQAAAQKNIENLFQSHDEQAQAVKLASDTDLAAATLSTDRARLRETVNAKAAELGISADDLQLRYTQGLLANAIQKYGIDVSAETARAGQAVEKYGIDTSAATARRGQDVEKYGIDTSAATARRGQDVEKYGIDTSAATAKAGQDVQRYGIDVGAKTAKAGQAVEKYGIDTGAATARGAQDVQRYGIDVGASIDREKLAQAGREFQEDLAYKLQALAQADGQFQAQFGLDTWTAQDKSNQGWFDRATTA